MGRQQNIPLEKQNRKKKGSGIPLIDLEISKTFIFYKHISCR